MVGEKVKTKERPEPSICTTASDGRSDRDESPSASETEATDSSRFLQLIRLQDGSAENGSEFLPTELLPLLLDFLPVDEVIMFDVRAVSRFFASPKAWVFHLFKLMDIDSLPTWSSEKQQLGSGVRATVTRKVESWFEYVHVHISASCTHSCTTLPADVGCLDMC